MLRAQIFTQQSAEPLKMNRSLSDNDRDQAEEEAKRQNGKEAKDEKDKKNGAIRENELAWETDANK